MIFENSGGVSNVLIENCTVTNAYDFWRQTTQSLSYGNIRIVNCNIYAIRRVWSLCVVTESIVVDNVISNPALFYDAAIDVVFSGAISNGSGGPGTILNVASVNAGVLDVGNEIVVGAIRNTRITNLDTGSGGTETYTVDKDQFVVAGTNNMRAILNLLPWTLKNGVWLHIWGNGIPTNASTTLVGGFQASNLTVYGYRYGIHVDTGSLDLISFDKSCTFDGTPQVC